MWTEKQRHTETKPTLKAGYSAFDADNAELRCDVGLRVLGLHKICTWVLNCFRMTRRKKRNLQNEDKRSPE